MSVDLGIWSALVLLSYLILSKKKLLTVDSFSISSSDAPREARPISCEENETTEVHTFVFWNKLANYNLNETAGVEMTSVIVLCYCSFFVCVEDLYFIQVLLKRNTFTGVRWTPYIFLWTFKVHLKNLKHHESNGQIGSWTQRCEANIHDND